MLVAALPLNTIFMRWRLVVLAQENKHKFSITEYLSLFEQEIISDTPSTELLNGEIFELSPLGFRHAKTQQLIQNFLITAMGTSDVYQNGSIIAGDNDMPEPDIYVLKEKVKIEKNYPTAEQLKLVVEVADSTIRTDTVNDGSSKLGIYARACIATVWVVDVDKQVIHEFTEPKASIYQNCKIHFGETTLFGRAVSINPLIAE